MFSILIGLACQTPSAPIDNSELKIDTPRVPPTMKPSQPPVFPDMESIDMAMTSGQVLSIGTMNINYSPKTHAYASHEMISDYNVYPMNNAVILQGMIEGSIGKHKHVFFGFTGVKENGKKDMPLLLEAMLIYEVPEDDGPGEYSKTFQIESLKKDAVLQSVESMTIEDSDGDGQFEVRASVYFKTCCEKENIPYLENMHFELQELELIRQNE